jgi:hypothetical protein
MKKILRNSAPFLLAMVLPSLVFAGDLKYTQRAFYDNGPSHNIVYYVKGERKRMDNRSYIGGQTPESFVYGPRTAMIMQCDLDRTLHLNLDAKKYLIEPTKPSPFIAVARWLAALLLSRPSPPFSHSERAVALEETGDKKQFHNREAWLVRQTTKSAVEYEGVTHNSTTVEESWYIDLDVPMYCRKQTGVPPNTKVQGRLSVVGQDLNETRTGSARTGFLISQQQVMMSPTETHTLGMEVVDWSEEPLDPRLFEVPDGFSETKEWKDIYPPLGGVPRPTGAWEKFLQWMKHFFSTP